MYSQTATLLDSCAHSAARAEGPAMITRALCLLAQRLAAVARMRAAYVLRSGEQAGCSEGAGRTREGRRLCGCLVAAGGCTLWRRPRMHTLLPPRGCGALLPPR